MELDAIELAETAELAETEESPHAAELAETARYRESMYRSAAAAFTQEPSEEQLGQLVDVALAAGEGGYVRESERQLLSHLRQYEGADFAVLRTQVATEYAELFVGPRAPLAPLYESVYVGPLHRLNTDVTMQVRRFYERMGLEVVKRNTVPNDHMGLELEFMAALCAREAQAWGSGDVDEAQMLRDEEAAFLKEHLGMWTDAFAARVSEAYCADYYDAWTRFVQTFVAEEQEYLAD